MTAPITAFFGETLKSGSGQLAVADYSGTTNVAGLYGPTGVGGYASGQFQAVTVGSSGVTIVSAAGQGGVKILGNKPQEGDPCQLIDIGEFKAIAGAAITVGQVLMTDADGRFVPWVDEEGNVPVGEARTPASQANDIFTMFIFPNASGTESFSTQANVTTTTGGVQVVAQMVNISTGVASGVLLLPPAIAGTVVFISDDQGATEGTAITCSGTDKINSNTTEVTTASAYEEYIFFCVQTGHWRFLKSTATS